MRIANPQSPHSTIEVCDKCGWPPALDGRCLCHYPEHVDADDRFPDYSAYMLDLRRRFGFDPPVEHN
jgi:hypothetical protein